MVTQKRSVDQRFPWVVTSRKCDDFKLSKKADDGTSGDFLLAIRRRFDVSMSMLSSDSNEDDSKVAGGRGS